MPLETSTGFHIAHSLWLQIKVQGYGYFLLNIILDLKMINVDVAYTF